MNGLASDQALRLLRAVPARRARRTFDGERLSPEQLDSLAKMAEWRPWQHARAVLVREAPAALFLGIVGSYGGISDSPSALAFIGSDRARPETVGYTGEGVVLAATALGLDTCWVAGIFSPHAVAELVNLESSEHVFAVSALGHALSKPSIKERVLFSAARAKHRRTLEEIAPGSESWPAWARAAAETARVAPSAMNRQPWRFGYSDEGLTIAYAGAELPRVSKRLDCGIAMMHAELGAFGAGVTGCWDLLDSPKVARFTPSAG